MKTRAGYVSNSSSSSFIITNWSNLPEDKKDKILNYQKHALNEWNRLGVALVRDQSYIHPDYNQYGENSADKIDVDSEYDFGYLDHAGWLFKERPENGSLEMVTSMDNFNMEKWMDHIGGFDYKWAGETWGYFSDERPEPNPLALEELLGEIQTKGSSKRRRGKQ